VPQATSGDRLYQPEQELSRLEGIVPRSTGAPEQPLHAKPIDAAVFQQAEALNRILPRDSGGESNQAQVEMPRSMSPSDTTASYGAAWSQEGGDQQSSSHETPWRSPEQEAELPSDRSADRSAPTVAAWNMMPPQPRPAEPAAVAPMDRLPPAGPAQAAEPHASQIGRAILFQVAEPDLGHINVRVSLANEVVHAYLSSDRPEVGQFLLNGQDRLQSALQANGLEMGQFRVDIDRQSAGRSFQQGQPQEHNRMWQPSTSGSEEDHGVARPHDYRVAGYTGMLNLVA
jgi:flagellar hook-length control protein FliK